MDVQEALSHCLRQGRDYKNVDEVARRRYLRLYDRFAYQPGVSMPAITAKIRRWSTNLANATHDLMPQYVVGVDEEIAICQRILLEIALYTPQVGMRVRTVQSIARFDVAIVQVGLSGTVTYVEDHCIAIKMDEEIPGFEEWDNKIYLSEDELGDYGHGLKVDTMDKLFSYYFEPIEEGEAHE